MANGDVFVIHIGGQTDFADCGTLHNTVTIGADNEPADADGNNTDDADVVVNCPVLGIIKTPDHQAPVLIGSQIGFTVTVANNGEGTAFGLNVSDTLDPAFSWSIESQTGGLTWSLVGNQLSASGDLPPGMSSVHVVAQTSAANSATQCGLVPNTAILSQGETEFPPASAAETVRCPGLTIDKSAVTAFGDTINPDTGFPVVAIGDTVSYTLKYTLVDGPVTNGIITDVVPAGLQYVAGTATNNEEFTFGSAVVNANGTTTLTWTRSDGHGQCPAERATHLRRQGPADHGGARHAAGERRNDRLGSDAARRRRPAGHRRHAAAPVIHSRGRLRRQHPVPPVQLRHRRSAGWQPDSHVRQSRRRRRRLRQPPGRRSNATGVHYEGQVLGPASSSTVMATSSTGRAGR